MIVRKNKNFYGGKNMKRFLALLLALCMVFALCACGGGDSGKKEDPKAGNDWEVTNKEYKVRSPKTIAEYFDEAEAFYHANTGMDWKK